MNGCGRPVSLFRFGQPAAMIRERFCQEREAGRHDLAKGADVVAHRWAFRRMHSLWKWQQPDEEPWNVVTHLVAGIVALPACALLLYESLEKGGTPRFAAMLVYGLCTLFLLWVSTLYHAVPHPADSCKFCAKMVLRYLDHIAIYCYIAGAYTPVCVIVLSDGWAGRALLVFLWSTVVVGVVVKIMWFDSTSHVSMVSFLGLGWTGLVVMHRVWATMAPGGIVWVAVAALSFTLGLLPFAEHAVVPYLHTVWHCYVVLGCAGTWAVMHMYL